MLTLDVEWTGLDRLVTELEALQNLDLSPVAQQCVQHIIEGNRRGVLSGVDGNNQPMPALKYRDGRGKKTKNRRVPDFGTNVFAETGRGVFDGHVNDNLTTAEYRELTGPRLAPRREQSRAIKNLIPRIDHPDDNTWVAVAAWAEVVSVKGVEFLPFHFDGDGHNPQYDLRPVRPEDLQFCRNALETFANQNFFASI